jgi:hypothetical protein
MDPSELAQVVRRGAPILCADTCTILDVMRDPTRESIRLHERTAAIELVALMEAGADIVGLIAEQVHIEFSEHADRVQTEADEAMSKLRDQITLVDAVSAAFGGRGVTDLGHLHGHVLRTREIVDRWIRASVLVTQTPEIAARAFARLNQARTPARKGKDSSKDCLVIETYLDVISSLRAAGLTSKIVFVSSNKDDYSGKAASTLKPDLQKEFSALSIDYAPNMAAAKHFLGF